MRKINRSSKSQLFAFVQKAIQVSVHAKKDNKCVDEILHEQKLNTINRRNFIQQTSKFALISSLAGTELLSTSFALKNKNATIAIVGAGIAGLTAAYYLKKAGYNPKIYEASNRTGGRIYTSRNLFAENSWTELGAEFIDTSHKQMWKFIKAFDLEVLDILSESEKELKQIAFYFNGQHYSEEEIIKLFIPFAETLQADQEIILSNYFSNKKSSEAIALDKLSLNAYLEKIGISGVLKSLLEVAFITEYGEDCENQSSVNLLSVIGTETKNGFKYYGESDERYKIKGGNQTIPEKLSDYLQNHIETDHYLGSIKKSASGKIDLEFMQSNGSIKNISADQVLITIPFTLLRDVNINADFPQHKLKCIQELGYGKNVKLFAGFNKKIWREQGFIGAFFTDNGIQSGWENTQLQQTELSGFTFFTGGKLSTEIGNADLHNQMNQFVKKMDALFPNVSLQFNQKIHKMHWPTFKYAKASYTSFKPGQYEEMLHTPFEPVGNIHFAGEHCSIDFQGFMNGAAETGRAAAKNIMKKLG